MNKVAFGLVSVVALVVGCGSSGGESSDDPFGPDPDYASIQTRFDHPDGTFSGAAAGSVLKSATSQSASPVFGPGATSTSGTKTQSLQPLGGSAFAGCRELLSGQRSGSCACPSGGSLAWDIEGTQTGSQSGEATMRFRMDACASGTDVIDGREFLRIASRKNGQSYDMSMLFVAHATVTHGGVVHTIDVEEILANGKMEIAAKVDDGWVVVAITAGSDGKNGSFSVRDKNGTWTCTVTNGAGSCTSDKGASVDWKS